MSAEVFAALVLFAFVTSVTPGPNNVMLLASGVNFGFRRTVPHVFGISGGFFVLLLCVGFGLGAILARFPAAHTVLRVAGGVYMLYLAWRIAMSRSLTDPSGGEGRPLTFLQAAAFQWVNPKAWAIAIGGMAAYTDASRYAVTVLIVGIVFAVVNLPSVAIWAGFGVALRSWLADPVRLKWFNIAMGVALVLSLWPMLQH